ncbi:ABC transporter permease [Bordetella genomosp. 4]|uniref:ABC transporter permease n=1 Tax=Bordetella genomosp. 4 TaxID=463044 RepID=A0A261TNE9_9BORD|nr:ABC transporter permease [Bordetella genomosp. 4]
MRDLLETYGTALAGLVLVMFFVVAAPNFAAPGNLLNILKETSFLAILALGFTLALINAELDLSIADVASLSAVVCGALIHTGQPVPWAIAAGLGAGALCGLINGLAVTRLQVPSLIATLGMAAMARGFAFMLTGGVAFVGRWPASFTSLGRTVWAGVPVLVLWMAGVVLAALFLVKWTRTGARMTATGEAAEAARLAGINTRRMKCMGLTLAGLLAGVTAVLLTASLSSAAPNMAGDYFLYAIAAVLLGMTMFEPGRANIFGTLVAALILKVLGNGLVLMGAPYYVQDIVLGFIIIVSVALSAAVLKKAAFKL